MTTHTEIEILRGEDNPHDAELGKYWPSAWAASRTSSNAGGIVTKRVGSKPRRIGRAAVARRC